MTKPPRIDPDPEPADSGPDMDGASNNLRRIRPERDPESKQPDQDAVLDELRQLVEFEKAFDAIFEDAETE